MQASDCEMQVILHCVRDAAPEVSTPVPVPGAVLANGARVKAGELLRLQAP